MTLLARLRQNPWQLLVIINAVVMIGVFLYKIRLPPYVPYIHLLVDYHFGFTKRALIGATLGLFIDKVPVWLVFALAGIAWLITLALFVRLFRRTFGRDAMNRPLFVFMAGSPFFLKNFMFTLGHFDIYGCAAALALMLVPADSLLFVVAAALAAMILILIHHIHLLMYVPTIVLIVIVRHYFAGPVTRRNVGIGLAALGCVGALFLAAQFEGTMRVPQTEFVAYLRSRMADPADARLLTFPYIWYQTLAGEVRDTWARMPSNIWGIPVFVVLLALHAPLWRYFIDTILGVASDAQRRIIVAGVGVVSLAYLVMFAMVFDYSRWISNWVTCLFLILHLAKTLPASRPTAPIAGDIHRNKILGWIVTLIPRVGIVRPF